MKNSLIHNLARFKLIKKKIWMLKEEIAYTLMESRSMLIMFIPIELNGNLYQISYLTMNRRKVKK